MRKKNVHLNRLFSYLILLLRPLLGPNFCPYKLSCGKYALQQLQEKSLFSALYAIIKRLVSCHPWASIKPEEHSLYNQFFNTD